MSSLPSLATAMALLEDGHRRNPGAWMAHSINVGGAARHIAERVPGLDPDRVYILGLLHDIGRREGISGMRHIVDGWRFLNELGYPDAARIALTHSFPLQDPRGVFGGWDCDPADVEAASQALMSIAYNEEDRLLQLCDCLATADGFCLMEKRLVDVLLRYGRNGVDPIMHAKWTAYFDLLRHFNHATGGSIYRLLPNVVETTFESAGWAATEGQ